MISVENGPMPSFGIPALEAYLNQSGIKSEILYPRITGDSLSGLVSKVLELKPSVVGLGGLFNDRFVIKRIIESFRPHRRNFKIVVGGNLVTAIPEFMLNKLSGDIAVIGEGELIFTKLVKKILGNEDLSSVGGLVFKDGDRVITTGPGQYIEDLNELLGLNYEKIPMEYFIQRYKFYKNFTRNSIFTPSSRVGNVFTGRGCLYKCNFCYHFNKLRLLDIPAVVSQARELKNRFSVNMVSFSDDLALINKQRTLELCRALQNERLDLKYLATAHFACLDEEMVAALKESGFVQIGLGLESGSQEVLDRINKNVKVEQIRKGLDLLRKYKLNWNGGIQIGQLAETEADFKKTINLFYPYIDKLSTVSIVITTPYPGTPLFYYGLRLGLIRNMEEFFYKFADLRSLVVNFSKIKDWRIYYLRLKTAFLFDLKKQRHLRGRYRACWFLVKILIRRFVGRFMARIRDILPIVRVETL